MALEPPRPPLFPYTTLFRSREARDTAADAAADAQPWQLHRLAGRAVRVAGTAGRSAGRSEVHTSELQSHVNLVCRLLLEKKTPRYLSRESADYLLSACVWRI